MDVRVLRYFLAVAREQSFSVAAERLFLSQPTLSRQLKELEDELGKTLFIRSTKGVTLTEEGMMLRKRAEQIVELMDKTEREMKESSELVLGTVYIGAGETYAIKLIADTAQKLCFDYPDIHYDLYSGDSIDVLDRLDKGLVDFGIVFQAFDDGKYESVQIPLKDTFGVLMRKDSPLSCKVRITLDDLKGEPLIIPRQRNHSEMLMRWLGEGKESDINIVAEYNLVYNGSVMAGQGMGYCLCLDKIINASGDSDLVFRPLDPPVEVSCNFIWKRYSVFTKAAETFLQQFKKDIEAFGAN